MKIGKLIADRIELSEDTFDRKQEYTIGRAIRAYSVLFDTHSTILNEVKTPLNLSDDYRESVSNILCNIDHTLIIELADDLDSWIPVDTDGAKDAALDWANAAVRLGSLLRDNDLNPDCTAYKIAIDDYENAFNRLNRWFEAIMVDLQLPNPFLRLTYANSICTNGLFAGINIMATLHAFFQLVGMFISLTIFTDPPILLEQYLMFGLATLTTLAMIGNAYKYFKSIIYALQYSSVMFDVRESGIRGIAASAIASCFGAVIVTILGWLI